MPLCNLPLFMTKSLLCRTVGLSVRSEKTVSAPQANSGGVSHSEITDVGTKTCLETGTHYCLIKLPGNFFELFFSENVYLLKHVTMKMYELGLWQFRCRLLGFFFFSWYLINFMVLQNF